MHDEASPHFLRTVRQHLDQTFGEQWIEHGGPVNCPARSPDLSPLDFGCGKSAPISGLEALQKQAENACQEVRVKPGIFDRAHLCVTKS
jgi:hypothetical protein